jgi:Mg-chelatase subunit ChlD
MTTSVSSSRPGSVACSTARIAAALLALALAPAPRVLAQSTVASAEARAAQFVFVIDDSGSMRQSDPNRLAVFAVQSLLGMLDDRDEVSVVRLNGPRDGSPPPPIEPLRDNRERMERLLALEGSLADYSAQVTPCTSALRSVHRLLEESYRSEAAQVAFFLTDGRCDPADFDRGEARAFLHGLSSHQAGQLQFYLLRFRGQAFTPELARLAEETGGAAFEVAADDPTAILHPFAQALSRSQGYEAYLLAPGHDRLDAHRGAERVRLLAVAPGSGEALGVTVQDARGRRPETLGRVRTGVHRYGDGRAFRYVALDFRPDVAPVTVSVAGAGAGWKVVAVPEYRLTLALRVHRGSCSDPGEAVEFGVDTGTSVCVVAELRNAQGEVVDGSLTRGQVEAMVRVRRPEDPGAVPVELVANPIGDEARFGVPRSSLTRGQYEFEPEVTLRLSSGEAITLRGRPVALEVASIEIAPEPGGFDLGTLAPGDVELRTLRFGGAFPPEPGRIELVDRAEVPSCVTMALSGVPEGETQPIRVDHGYELAVRVAPYCGPRSFERDYRTILRLSFEQAPGSRRLPSVDMPLSLHLDAQIGLPPALAIAVGGGETADLAVPLTGNFTRDLEMVAVVAGPDEAEAWPEDEDDLALGVAGEAGAEAQDQARVTVPPGGAAATAALVLRARAHRCCTGGTYRTRLGLAPAAAEAYAPGAPAPEPLVVPVEVSVAPAGLWACWGPTILWALAALLVLLLLLYLANMVRNSRLLDPRQVADRLHPLVWTAYGGAEERPGVQDDVRRLVRRGMPWSGRLQTWLRANPLRFGLPGGSYEETIELALRPHRDVAASQVHLVPERQALDSIRDRPEDFWGRLFASARAGVTFVGVPDVSGHITRLSADGLAASAASPDAPDGPRARAVTLRKAELLRPLDVREVPEEGAAAGWRVG